MTERKPIRIGLLIGISWLFVNAIMNLVDAKADLGDIRSALYMILATLWLRPYVKD